MPGIPGKIATGQWYWESENVEITFVEALTIGHEGFVTGFDSGTGRYFVILRFSSSTEGVGIDFAISVYVEGGYIQMILLLDK